MTTSIIRLTMTYSYIIKSKQKEQIILTRSGNYTITLAGEGAHVDILGAFHLKNSDKLNLNIITTHAAPHTSANTLIKVIADDQSQAMVNGTIIVAKIGQQTNSFLTEKILMLSDKASAQAIPNLEIEADDVKCSHAATIGKIPEEQLFYLQSRGITRAGAKKLVAKGFLSEVTNLFYRSSVNK